MIVFFAGAAMQNSGLMGAGATTFLVAVFIDYRRAQKCKAERQIAVEKRIRNLTSKKWQEGNSLAVPSGTAFFLVVAIPIAAAGYLSPMLGALSMAFSDVIVVGNSLRLRTRKIHRPGSRSL